MHSAPESERYRFEQTALSNAIFPVLDSIDGLTRNIHLLHRKITRLCEEKYPEPELLRQVAGVASLTALAFVLPLESPDRFRKSRDVGAYLGLTPKRDQSGQSDKPLPISKTPSTKGARAALRAQRDGPPAGWQRTRPAGERQLPRLAPPLWTGSSIKPQAGV
jgi:hypothetical protein